MPTNAILVLKSRPSSLKFGVYSTDPAEPSPSAAPTPFVGAGLAPPGVSSKHAVNAQAPPSHPDPRPLYRGEIEGVAAGEGKIWFKDSAGKTLEEESRTFAQQSEAVKDVAEKLSKLK